MKRPLAEATLVYVCIVYITILYFSFANLLFHGNEDSNGNTADSLMCAE